MRRQTKFNANVVYVRKGARLFQYEGRSQAPSPPIKEKKLTAEERIRVLAEMDKEVGKLILKLRLELENMTDKRRACAANNPDPKIVEIAAIELGRAKMPDPVDLDALAAELCAGSNEGDRR